MKKNGQKNGRDSAAEDRGYLKGIRECFGTLESAVSLLPMEKRSEFTDTLKELFEKVRAAEKRVGEGA